MCLDLTGTMASFTCTLPKNSDNTATLSSGNHYPVILISPIGYAAIDTAIPAINVAFSLTSLNPANGNANGGYDLTIIGTGFPSDPSQVTFKVCDQFCTIKSLNNINAVLTTPSCTTVGASTI